MSEPKSHWAKIKKMCSQLERLHQNGEVKKSRGEKEKDKERCRAFFRERKDTGEFKNNCNFPTLTIFV